jgi:hypothetical protein
MTRLGLVLGVLLAAGGTLRAQDAGEAQVRKFFQAHCTESHDG